MVKVIDVDAIKKENSNRFFPDKELPETLSNQDFN